MTNQEYLTLNEVSEHLRISVSTLRKWLAKGHIPSDTYIHVRIRTGLTLVSWLTRCRRARSNRDRRTQDKYA